MSTERIESGVENMDLPLSKQYFYYEYGLFIEIDWIWLNLLEFDWIWTLRLLLVPRYCCCLDESSP